MKKILIILGILVLALIIVNGINIKSNYSYKISDNSKIKINGGAGNVNFTSNSNESTLSGYFNHKIFSEIGFVQNSNEFNLTASKVNGNVDLPKNTKFAEISLALGAGNLDLDLKMTNVQELSLSSGASNVRLVLPQDISSKFNLAIGSGNLDLVIPTNGKIEGVKIISTSLTNMNLGEAWVKTADGIQTKDFQKAKLTSIIDLTKGGSVSLNISSVE